MSSPTSLLEISHLTIKIESRLILNDVSFLVQAGEIVTIVGPNGAGKSTLLRAILGLIPITSGKVQQKLGLRIGYMPQKTPLESSIPLSVSRFLTLTQPKPDLKTPYPHSLIHDLRLTSLLNRSIHDLSGGEWQRVLLARALIKQPELLILDEPAQNADIHGQAEFYRYIQTRRAKTNCAVLMVSHDLTMVMAETDRVLCLNQHLCCTGTPHEVSQNPQFLEAFGLEKTAGLAFYQHVHNHHHD